MLKQLHWLKGFRSELWMLRHLPTYSQCSLGPLPLLIASTAQASLCYAVACMLRLCTALVLQSIPAKNLCSRWLSFSFAVLQETGEAQDGGVAEEGQDSWSG